MIKRWCIKNQRLAIITWSAVLILCTGIILPLTGTANITNLITKVQSGLVTSDSLTTGDTSNWTFAGTATISVEQCHYPMAANIKVYDSANNMTAPTANVVNIFGGNVYSVKKIINKNFCIFRQELNQYSALCI